jgi:hypothetical protein
VGCGRVGYRGYVGIKRESFWGEGLSKSQRGDTQQIEEPQHVYFYLKFKLL